MRRGVAGEERWLGADGGRGDPTAAELGIGRRGAQRPTRGDAAAAARARDGDARRRGRGVADGPRGPALGSAGRRRCGAAQDTWWRGSGGGDVFRRGPNVSGARRGAGLGLGWK